VRLEKEQGCHQGIVQEGHRDKKATPHIHCMATRSDKRAEFTLEGVDIPIIEVKNRQIFYKTSSVILYSDSYCYKE
jgi:hypothetical protein